MYKNNKKGLIDKLGTRSKHFIEKVKRMRKRHILLIGVLTLMVFWGIPKKVNAEANVAYSIEGTIEYYSDDIDNIIYNISIPIKLHSSDMLYWYNHYVGGRCSVLQIIFYWRPDPPNAYGGVAFYPVQGDNNICEMRFYHSIGNIGTDYGDNTFVIIQKNHDSRGFYYKIDWRFWIEREIVENPPNDIPSNIIGLNIMPLLLALLCIGVILISTQTIKRGIKFR